MTRTKEDQLALEREMLTLGRDRVELIAHRQQQKGQQSLSKWGEHLAALGVEQLVPHLRAVRKRIESGRAGPSFALLAPLTHLPPPASGGHGSPHRDRLHKQQSHAAPCGG